MFSKDVNRASRDRVYQFFVEDIDVPMIKAKANHVVEKMLKI